VQPTAAGSAVRTPATNQPSCKATDCRALEPACSGSLHAGQEGGVCSGCCLSGYAWPLWPAAYPYRLWLRGCCSGTSPVVFAVLLLVCLLLFPVSCCVVCILWVARDASLPRCFVRRRKAPMSAGGLSEEGNRVRRGLIQRVWVGVRLHCLPVFACSACGMMAERGAGGGKPWKTRKQSKTG